jgi:endonuclease I
VSRADPPLRYYESAQGKSGQALRQALHNIIKGHIVILYDSSVNVDTVEALKVLDEDPANTNNVILIYSGWSVAKTNYGVSGWNREHLWPNSYGFDIDVTTTWPALRDLFNLRPCDSRVNSSRGNKYFDFSDPTDGNYRSSAHPNAPLCSTDTDSWEPPDSMKGDIARAMFYMDVRYAGEYTNEADLVLTDNVASIASGSPFMGRLTTLLLWHRSDPVDAAEQGRNDLIYQRYQRNRNPFVDHPEWVDLVYLPKLFIAAQSNGVCLFWEANWTNVVLETVPQPIFDWFPVPVSPMNTGNQLAVFVASTNTQQFFRLKLK